MKGTINQDAKTLESRANSIRVSAILKKYTMVIALVVVFIFFTALTGGKMLYAQNISNLLLRYSPGDQVTVTLYRPPVNGMGEGDELEVTITLLEDKGETQR